jgi:hypothetical protein
MSTKCVDSSTSAATSADTDAGHPVEHLQPERPAGNRHRGLIVPVLLSVVVAVYLIPFVNRGWIPHDEGLLAHSAERVLQGELPHRDFDDAYTGGLSLLHALAFKLFGMKLTSIRWVLFFFAVAFVPSLYGIAVRALPRWLAVLAVLTCVVWSIPNYFAGLPSWYNLFFATFGTWAMLRYVETRRLRCLVVAGVCGGLSLLIKIVGLYFIAAALLFLVYDEQSLPLQSDGKTSNRSVGFLALIVFIATSFCGFVLLLLRRDLGVMEILNYLAPCCLVAALLIGGEWRNGRGTFRERFARLCGRVFPFLAGVAAPVAVFLIPFMLSGSLSQLVHGVFVLPQQRMDFATVPLPPLNTMLAVIPLAIILVQYGSRGNAKLTIMTTVLRVVVITFLAFFVLFSSDWYYSIWYSLRGAPVIVVCVASWMLMSRTDSNGEETQPPPQVLYLLVVVAVMMSLIQYPFAGTVYFCYCAPLVIMAICYLASRRVRETRFSLACTLLFYFAFGLMQLNQGYLTAPASLFPHDRIELELKRGGLHVMEPFKLNYERIIGLIQEHSAAGDFIYAAPDCPEVYFLSDRKNPTRTMYDFFNDPRDRTFRVLQLLDERRVNVVVINLEPQFSEPFGEDLIGVIRSRYPNMVRVSGFLVGWRDTSQAGVDPSPDPHDP